MNGANKGHSDAKLGIYSLVAEGGGRNPLTGEVGKKFTCVECEVYSILY